MINEMEEWDEGESKESDFAFFRKSNAGSRSCGNGFDPRGPAGACCDFPRTADFDRAEYFRIDHKHGRQYSVRQKEASVTVFLALIFLILLTFLCSLLESVRIRMARTYYQMALASAAESVGAGYCRELFEEYGLLFYWPREEGVVGEAEEYLSYYTEANQGLGQRAVNLYRLSSGQISARNIVRAGDRGARSLRLQMVEAVGYEEAGNLMAVLQGRTGLLEQGEQLREELEQAQTVFESTDWAQHRVETVRLPEEESAGIPEEKEWIEEMKKALDGSLLEKLRRLLRSPWLAMVLPDNTSVSSLSVNPEWLDVGFPAEGGFEPVLSSVFLEQVIVDEYVLQNTASFLEPRGESGLSYEMEYVLCGKDSDEDNLNEAVRKLLLLREGLNLLWLTQDPYSLQQAAALANTVVGWTMIPALVECAKLVILSGWAYAESVVDVRRLLSGETIPFTKSSETWEVTMERIPLLLTGGSWEYTASDSGLAYRDYFRILLLSQSEQVTVTRMAGIIQQRMRSWNGSFYLRDCISEAEYILKGELARGFLFLPDWAGRRMDIYGIILRQNFAYEVR